VSSPVINQHVSAAVASGSPTSLTTASRNTAGTVTVSLLVVWFTNAGAAAAPSSVQDNKGNGNATQVGATKQCAGASNLRSALFEWVGVAGGTGHTWTANFASPQDVITIFVVAMTSTNGVVRDSIPAGVATTSSPYTSNTVTPSAPDALLLGFTGTLSSSGTETLTWGSSFTTLGDDVTNANADATGGSASRTISVGGTYSVSFTSAGAGTTEAMVWIAAYKDSLSGGGATSIGFLPSDAQSPKLSRSTARALNSDSPTGQRIVASALAALSMWSFEPPPRSRVPSARPNDSGAQVFSPQYFGEPIVNDLPFTPSVRAMRVDSKADVFPSLGFAPSPAFTGWDVQPQKRSTARAQVAPESVLGARITSVALSGFADFAPSAPRQQSAATRAAADSWFLGTTQPPPGVFAQWSSDAPRGPATPARALNDAWPLESSPFPTSAFVGWSSDAPRALGQPSRLAYEPFSLSALASPPGVFAEWSIAPPKSWKSPPLRPDNAPISTAVTLPPSAGFFDWFVSERRGTAVKSRPPGESVLTGQFVPPPTLTGLPWQQDPPRVAQRFGRAAPEAFLGGVLSLPGIPWQQDATRPTGQASARPLDAYVGSALASVPALATFLAQDELRAAHPGARPSAGDSYLGAPLGLPGAPWAASDAPRGYRPGARLPTDGFVPTALAPTLAAFVDWAPPAPRAQSKQATRDAAWFLPPTVPPPITGFLQWSVEKPPVWIAPQWRPENHTFAFSSISEIFIEPAPPEWRAPVVDLRSATYAAKVIDRRSNS